MIISAVILALFLILRVILPLKVKWYYKVGLSILISAISFRFQLLHLIGGGLKFAPNLPAYVIIGVAGIYGMMIIFAMLILIRDAFLLSYRLILFISRKRVSERYRNTLNYFSCIALGISIILGGIGLYNGLKMPKVKVWKLEFAKLDKDLNGFKIAVLSDIHIDHTTSKARVEKLVELTNQENPDVIILLGDMVDGKIDKIGKQIKPLKNLKAKYGVYGIAGNHEYYSDYKEWQKYFTDNLKITMLDNQNIKLKNNKLLLAGVTDKMAKPFKFGEGPNLKKSLGYARADNFKILFAHRPEIAKESEKLGFDLQLSGHTHGGSIIGFDRLVAIFNEGYVSGLYDVNGLKLFVANGAGIWSGFPIRLGAQSSIDILILTRDN